MSSQNTINFLLIASAMAAICVRLGGVVNVDTLSDFCVFEHKRCSWFESHEHYMLHRSSSSWVNSAASSSVLSRAGFPSEVGGPVYDL